MDVHSQMTYFSILVVWNESSVIQLPSHKGHTERIVGSKFEPAKWLKFCLVPYKQVCRTIPCSRLTLHHTSFPPFSSISSKILIRILFLRSFWDVYHHPKVILPGIHVTSDIWVNFFRLHPGEVVILGTQYAGEMKIPGAGTGALIIWVPLPFESPCELCIV